MPLYNPTDEKLAALLGSYKATVEVDQAELQCYVVTRHDGTKAHIAFGASLSDFEKVLNVMITPAETVQ